MRRAPTGITLVTTHKRNYRKTRSRAELKSQSPSPPLKSKVAPARSTGTTLLLMPDDVTKHHHRFKTPLVWQGDGPLREPSPRQQGVLCTVVNH